MQLNQVYYNGDIPTPPGPISSTEVSEPGMMAIFAIALAGLAYTRRRRA